MQAAQQRSSPNLFGPTLLIGLGLLLLLSNLGYLSFDMWVIVVQLWPLLLIAIGINLLVGRNSSWVGVLVALLLILIVLSVALFVTPRFGALSGLDEPITIAQPIEGLERAEFNITSSVGYFLLDGDSPGDQLIAGTVTPLRSEKVSTRFQQEGDIARYWIDSKGAVTSRPFFLGPMTESRWELHLNPELPMQLNLTTGVGLADIDLRTLTISNLVINSGVGKTTVILPAQGNVTGKIQAGVGQLVVQIPSSMQAQVEAKAGLGGVNVQGNFSHSGNFYTTVDYKTSMNKVTLNVAGGVGEVRIEQIEE